MSDPTHHDTGSESPPARGSVRGQLPVGAVDDATLRALRDRFLADPRGTDLSQLRPVIERSWRRSALWSVDPDLRVFDRYQEPRADELLLRCAEPVLAELERIADDQGAAVCLADPAGTLVRFRGDAATVRRAERSFPTVGGVMAEDVVGTNGEGTALEEGTTVQTWGAEHFVDAMQGFCCTSVPIKDPLRRSIRAFLSLALPTGIAAAADPRSVALIVEGAAAELTRALGERLAVREQALLSAYLAELRKRGGEAVVVLDERTTIASKAALDLLQPSDLAALAGYARESERAARAVEREIAIGDDRPMLLDVRPIIAAGEAIGSVVRLREAAAPRHAGRPPAPARDDPFTTLVGESLALRRALDVAHAAVARRLPAVIVGEPGTGKRRLAEAMAARLARDVVLVDCAREVDPGAAVEATAAGLERGAAVVLDDVDRLEPAAIRRLGDLLAGRDAPPVVLTLAAVDDATVGLAGLLRSVEVEMPPLRRRREDVRLLAAHFLSSSGHAVERISAPLLRALAEADWPGNVAQLREYIETAAARCAGPELRLEHLRDAHRAALARSPLSRLEEAELQQIREALAEARGNRQRAAEILQIGRSTLYRKLESYERRGFTLDG